MSVIFKVISNVIFITITDLGKLNPVCHMNYSNFFTEISFYPGTSTLLQKINVKILNRLPYKK